MIKILKKIQEKLGNDILQYCICGSGKKYKECCDLGINDFLNSMFTDEKTASNFNSSNGKIPISQKINESIWESLKHGNCVFDGCDCKSIESHLYSESYLKKNGSNFLVGNKSNHANNIKTHLFCNKHDNELFELSDNIENFSDFIKDTKKLENYFLKLLFFKYKTLIILIIGILIDIKLGNKELYDDYNGIYKQYNSICMEIEKYNYYLKIDYHIITQIYIDIPNKINNTLFSNICFIKGCEVPIGVILTQDGGGLSLSISSYGAKIPDLISREIIGNINLIKYEIFIQDPKNGYNKLIKFIQEYFEIEEYYNRLMVIKNDFVDAGFYNIYKI